MNRKNSKLEAAMERKNSKTNEEQERRESQGFRFFIRHFQNPHFSSRSQAQMTRKASHNS